jgi:hypothetical protein
VQRFYPPASVEVVAAPSEPLRELRHDGKLGPRGAQTIRGICEQASTYEVRLDSALPAVARLPDGQVLKNGEEARLELQGAWEITIACEGFGPLTYSLALTPARREAAREEPKDGLNMLRQRLRRAEVPKREQNQYLLATWHLNDFGTRARLPAAFALIAEVISRFDVTIVTGVRNESAVSQLTAALGTDWQCVVSRQGRGQESFAVVAFDKRRVEFVTEQPQVETPVRSLVLGMFQVGGATIQLAALESARATDAEAAAADLVATLERVHRAAKAADLTLATAFTGIRGPESPELERLRQGHVDLPYALTCHGDNPPLDQIFSYPRKPGADEPAGLIDLYERSPKALFPDTGLTNQQAIDQLSVRSPAWVLLRL